MNTTELLEHMEKHKDALVLFGEKGLSSSNDIDQEMMSNKTLRRKPDEFWKYYFQNIVTGDVLSDAQKAVIQMDKKGLLSGIINLTFDDKFENSNMLINLHGVCSDFKCTTCKINYTKEYVTSFDSGVKCEVCGKPLRPNILLTGERYVDDKFNAFKQMVLDTHTLFIVGLDWNEDAVVDLIASYGDMKEVRNMKEADQRIMVAVGTDDIIDISDIGRFEFLVSGDVNESMKRFSCLAE